MKVCDMDYCKECGLELRGDVCEHCYDNEDEIRIMDTWYFKRLVPMYDETTLFVISVTAILSLSTNSSVIVSLTNEVRKEPFILIPIISVALALFYMIYHAFSNDRKSTFAKQHMLKVAVTINAVTGVVASVSAFKYNLGILGIFPLFNIVNAFILLIWLKFNLINEKNVSDANANLYEVLISLALSVLVFTVSKYAFKHDWYITFSMCLAYATNLNVPILMAIERNFGLNLCSTKHSVNNKQPANFKGKQRRKCRL